jgi:acyl-CoA synthetase (NDP forming)
MTEAAGFGAIVGFGIGGINVELWKDVSFRALVETILRVDRMVGDNPEIQELAINPLSALAPGHGVIAVDARIRTDKSHA